MRTEGGRGNEETYTVCIAQVLQFANQLVALLVAVDGAAAHGAHVGAGEIPRHGRFGEAARLLAADAGDGLFGLADVVDGGGHFVKTRLAIFFGGKKRGRSEWYVTTALRGWRWGNSLGRWWLHA